MKDHLRTQQHTNMKNLFHTIIAGVLLAGSVLFGAITGETNVRTLPSYEPTKNLVAKSDIPVGKACVGEGKYVMPQYSVKFTEILKARIPSRYKGHPELVTQDIKRVYDYRAKHNVLGVPHDKNGVLYDYYVGVSFYAEITGNQQSRSLTTAHGEMVLIPFGLQSSTITRNIAKAQTAAKGAEHTCPPQFQSQYDEYNGFSLNGQYMWIGTSAYGDAFHELGHVLNIPCSCAPINEKCKSKHNASIYGVRGVYIEQEAEFVNVLSMLRATGYNDLGLDMDAMGLKGYEKAVDAILSDSGYDVKHGREYGRIRNYVLKVGKGNFLRASVKYIPAIL